MDIAIESPRLVGKPAHADAEDVGGRGRGNGAGLAESHDE